MYGVVRTRLISIHASRVGGDVKSVPQFIKLEFISIHASRVGGDEVALCSFRATTISIHASRVGGDTLVSIVLFSSILFQSTPPGWEATICRHYFYQ